MLLVSAYADPQDRMVFVSPNAMASIGLDPGEKNGREVADCDTE